MTTGGRSVLGAKVRVPRIQGLPRERLDDVMRSVWQHRLGLVTAPAGSGKTTLLAHFAAACGAPVAWYRAEPADASAAAAVAHLERGLVGALGIAGGWRDVDDAVEALDAWQGDRALLAVDDLHALWGTEAEATLERLLLHLPPGLVMVAATRRAPGFNLSRLRVSGDLVEVGAEDLRFRSWEVERLFFEFYGESLPPDELAELARRTEGWAAGLQLFHLATRGKPAGERRRMLHELGMRSRLVREYLARNVLDELPLYVRDFLLQTCVLGCLTAPLCDEIRGATSSDVLLAELEQRQIFTAPLDDEGAYRYHEVLRSYLEAVLVESVGEPEARRRYQHAGRLLEAHGHLPEALRAYCRAEDWPAARELLGDRGEEVIDRPGAWLEALPPTLLEHDPWLLVASARRATAAGQWAGAIEAYGRAEAASGQGEPAASARRERVAIEGWFAPAIPSPAAWTGILRLAAARDATPVLHRERDRLTDAAGSLAVGLASLLAGRLDEAGRRLHEVAARADASTAVAVGAAIGAAVCRALAGDDVAAPELTGLAEAADAAGLPWLSGLTRLVAAMASGSESALASLVAKDDTWGLPLAQLCTGLGALRCSVRDAAPEDAERARGLLAEAADGFAALGAPVLEAWAVGGVLRSARAAGTTAVRQDERRWTRLLRETGVNPEAVLDRFVPAGVVDAPASGSRVRPPAPAAGTSPAAPMRLAVRCFGSLEVVAEGHPLDLSVIKPRVRSLLRVLALHAGRPVHRDRLVEWLWPSEGDTRVGTRNLQVAISSLRQLLEPGVARGAAAVVVRDGDTYRLEVAPCCIDLVEFDDLVAVGRHASAAGNVATALAALDGALALYRGELLADEGAAEWVTSERDRLQVVAADASQLRAQLLLDAGDPVAAVAEAERGLRIDQYRDALWRLLIRAADDAGDVARARRSRERYDAVLRDLGV